MAFNLSSQRIRLKKALKSRSIPIGKPMILQWLSDAKAPSATKSCLISIGIAVISFIISIYLHIMSITTNEYVSPQNSRQKFFN